MSTTLPWRQVYDSMLASPTFTVSGSGAVVYPRFGDYNDTIAGEVDVFMTLGADPFNVRSFPTCKNDCVPVAGDGSMTFTDSNNQTISLFFTPSPLPGPDRNFENRVDARDEP